MTGFNSRDFRQLKHSHHRLFNKTHLNECYAEVQNEDSVSLTFRYHRCPSCPEWKTRVLISHAVVSTVSAHDLPSVMKDIVYQLNPHNHNELHGLLLIVYRLIVDRHELLQVPHFPDSTLDVGLWLLEQLLIKPL